MKAGQPFWIAGFFLIAACARREPSPAPATSPSSSESPAIVFLGDSLTAGYGLDPEEAYPALIGEKIQAAHLAYHVINAGVSGDTTAGGLRRLEWALKARPKILVVALGANDGLRGLAVAETRKNLEAIIRQSQAAGCRVVLAGMKLPVNYGEEFRAPFERMYPELAKARGVALIPFLLKGVGGHPELNQADGLHPNREGHRRIAETVWPVLQPL